MYLGELIESLKNKSSVFEEDCLMEKTKFNKIKLFKKFENIKNAGVTEI
jgi:hypothetical protein